MKTFFSDFSKLIKLRLTFLVAFSASITYLIGSRMLISRGEIPEINMGNWCLLFIGGFLVTAAASCFNEVIEVDFDKLMKRTKDRPMAAGRMTTGQGMVIGLIMALTGTWLLNLLSLETGLLSIFSVVLYTVVYTPLKRKSPIAVLFGAIPGALPPLIGYLAAISQSRNFLPTDYVIAVILFLIQFCWQFPHFWAIAWVSDEDYKNAGFRLLPSTHKDKISAILILVSTVVLFLVSLLPTIYGFGGIYITIVSIISGSVFSWFAWKLVKELNVESARKVMFCSFFYIPLVQLVLLFDFVV